MAEKEQGSFFDVTMASYDAVELCEFIGICIQYILEGTLEKDLMGLYRDSGLIIIGNTNKRTKYEKRCKYFLKVLTSKLKLQQI